MKANEFVKRFGWCEAKSVLLKSEYHYEVDVYLVDTKEFVFIAIQPDDFDPYISLIDLKRLVESWELVEKYGGLDGITKWIESDGLSARNIDFNRAIQAIADVESCQ